MTLEDLGNIGEFIGALAVVISLLYLALQIRHSSRIARFEAHRNLSESIANILGAIATNEDIYRVWKIMTETPENASADDRERFGMIMHQFFTTISDAHRFADIDSHLAVRYTSFLDRYSRMPAVRAWWTRQGRLYSEPFKSKVDALMNAATEH